ncbi:MAG: hypothetical protein EXR79_03695 [Myxococcales bacterium]|nr:hypothetical protein [Myxococcales bacterium]
MPVPQPAVQTALPNCTVRERTRATAQLARTPGALAFFLHGDAPAPTAACSAPFHVTGGGSALQDWIRLLEVAHLIVVASAHRDDTPVGAAPMPWAGLAPRVTVLNARAQLDLW